jgi:hypothetical protein
MLIVLAASGCSTVLEKPTQNLKIETLNPASAGSKNEKCPKKFRMKLIMLACSKVEENSTHDPKIGGSNQATGVWMDIMAKRVNYVHS